MISNILPDIRTFAVLALLTHWSWAAPPPSLDVKLTVGTFRGVSTAVNGTVTEKWLGIPFATPPLGALRFKAPVAPPRVSGGPIKDASAFGNACPQPASSNLGAPISEDCLFLNVYRPPGTKATDKLPVLVWLHGGGYITGAASASDPTRIVQRSAAIGKPIIFVSTNYRLNTFGFLASANVPNADLNAGLLDQRQAFVFLQQNIAAFGGDPAKVTIWGQSAGAGSVETHFLFPAKQSLFRAGISDSSTGPFKNSPPAKTYDEPGKPFARLLAETGCAAGPGSVACLRQVPFQTLLSISNTMIQSTLNQQLWQPAPGPAGSLMPTTASKQIRTGNFLHLPYLAGTNVNEGAGFSTSLRNLRLSGNVETAAFDTFISKLLIDNSTVTTDVLNGIHNLFPSNDPLLGAPFNTGDSLFDRAEAWYTDNMYLAPRRLFFQFAASLQPMFAYYFREFIPGNDPVLGVSHGSELVLLFGPVPDVELTFANQFLDFYINFVTNLNPGAPWPRYTSGSKSVLQLLRDNVTAIPDNWDTDKTDFLNTQRVLNEFQK